MHVTLKEIGENPRKFAGKIIEVIGYAWGWMAKRPREAENLPVAKNNTAESRSEGNFEDGTAIVFIPIAPTISGRFKIFSEIVIKGDKWLFRPITMILLGKK